MTEAERLAERLLDLVSNFTKPSYRNTLTDSAALIRSQAEELERLRGALEKAQKPKLISTVAVLNDDGSQSFSSQGLGER